MTPIECEMLAIALYESQARSNMHLGGRMRAWLNEDEMTREEWRQRALTLYYTEVSE